VYRESIGGRVLGMSGCSDEKSSKCRSSPDMAFRGMGPLPESAACIDASSENDSPRLSRSELGKSSRLVCVTCWKLKGFDIWTRRWADSSRDGRRVKMAGMIESLRLGPTLSTGMSAEYIELPDEL
jgi:hypothetical protein